MSDKDETESKNGITTSEISDTRVVPTSPALPNGRKAGALLFVVVVLCMFGGFIGARVALLGSSTAIAPTNQIQNTKNDGNAIVTQSEQDITSVVNKVSPSVVSIVTSAQSSQGAMESAGTGIIISSDGYIITNNHVIAGATNATVVLTDGTTYNNVKILGSDPLNDLAFLKINNVSGLTPATLGNSSTVRTGQQVVAIGNALGQYQNTVSSGIISGTGRPVSASDGSTTENLTDLLQTDAAINPGNSGGPLLNIAGQVIGIDTAVAQDAQGIGFAIPINAAKGEIASVIAGKGVQRAYIGINYVPITPDVAQQYKLPVKQGAYVYAQNGSAIISGSPAARAGIQNKDIITAINGTEIGIAGSLSTLVSQYQPGDTIQLTVLRGGKTTTISVTLAKYVAQTSSYQSSNPSQPSYQDLFNQLFGGQ